MSFPSRLQIGILVTAATLIICSLGVRAELKKTQSSVAEHRLQTHPAPEDFSLFGMRSLQVDATG